MSRIKKPDDDEYQIVYVRSFRHWRTGKVVRPKPPNTRIRLRIKKRRRRKDD